MKYTQEEIYEGLKKIILDKKIEKNIKKSTMEYDNSKILENVIELIEKQGESSMKISILTPTYNRKKLLKRLYTSLLENSKLSSFDK